MVRTLKNRRKQRYQFDKNRKNLKKKLKSTGKVNDATIRKQLDVKKSLSINLKEMGLVSDIRKKFKTENYREKQTKQIKKLVNGFVEEDNNEEELYLPKKHIRNKMEEEANAPKESKFRLPKVQVKELGYFIDKYGLNYKMWTKDHKKNYDQLTWRQYRAKCRKFMNIPEQFGEWMDEKGILDDEISLNDPKWKEYCTDDEE